jgi:predicted acyltransferase
MPVAIAVAAPSVPPLGKPESRRAYALDALRGIAILGMVLSGILPNTLPAWMFHAQNPPPTNAFHPEIPGITWVDLVWPTFLFSMGAAFPLALSKRLGSGASIWLAVWNAVRRFVLLAFFSLFVQHVRPFSLSASPDRTTMLVALLAFFLVFPVLSRFPDKWPVRIQWLVRLLGWAGVIALLAAQTYADGRGFSVQRFDTILMVLANMALVGTIIWLITRGNVILRLGFIALYVAFRLSHDVPGWTQTVWNWTPADWLYQFRYLQYVCVIVPGTIVGDFLLNWIRDRNPAPERHWPGWRSSLLALLCFAFVPVVLTGMFTRHTTETAIACFVMCAAGWALVRNPLTNTEHLLRNIFTWSAFWLVLGLALEPYEGGIQKGRATLSFYFVTVSLSSLLLMTFTVIADVFSGKRWIGLLVDNGQNPMIAYLGHTNFIGALLFLTGIGPWMDRMTPTPWAGFWKCIFVTLLVALSVRMFTRWKIYWRT